MSSYKFFADRSIEKYRKSDVGFLICVILLWGLGLFSLYFVSQSAATRLFDDSLYFVKRQFICSLIGFVGFTFFAALKISAIRKLLPVIVIGTAILCLLTFIPGISLEKNGARRWIKMPFSFTLQPSELVKFALILFLANLFDKQSSIERLEDRSVLPCVIGVIFFVSLILMQKDFSTSVFIFGICLLMFLVSGMKVTWLIPLSILAIPTMILLVTLEPYRVERIIGFLKPEEGIHTFNYQSNAAKRAISAGGFWGTGIGTGLVQSNRIPEVQADYIFAGWAEAMGLIGVIAYFVLLGFFAWKGIKISLTCENRFASYGTFGCVAAIVLQSLMNCGVVCGALPSTGIPLPFFSLGGSSIIVTLSMCGFVLNASRGDFEDEIKADDYIQLNTINGVI